MARTTTSPNKAIRPSHIAAFCLLAIFCFDSLRTEPSMSGSPLRMLTKSRDLLSSKKKEFQSNLATWGDLEQYHEGKKKESSAAEEDGAASQNELPRANEKLPYHPIFWHVPKAGGTSLQKMMSSCLHLVVGNHIGYHRDQSDHVKILFAHRGPEVPKYVNVDLSTSSGIDHAVDIGLPEHLDMVDVMVTPLFQPITQKIVSEEEQGILFTILRHPVERAVSAFHYLKKADWETATYRPEWKNWTIQDYIDWGKMDRNWMTSVLSGDAPYKLNEDSLELAKEVLRKHTVIGLIDEMEESIRRFGRVFGWDEEANFESCMEEFASHPSNSNKHSALDPESEEWKKLEAINNLDTALYNYAVELFHEQGRTFFEEQEEEAEQGEAASVKRRG